MILDQVFFGVINESVGTLEVYDEPVEDVSRFGGQNDLSLTFQPMYQTALDTLRQMGEVVNHLYDKVSTFDSHLRLL